MKAINGQPNFARAIMVTVNFMCAKRFRSLMRQKRKKFGQEQKVELKKSFKFDSQILSKGLTKVGTNFVNFAQRKVSEMKPLILCSKRPFSYQPSIRKDCFQVKSKFISDH